MRFLRKRRIYYVAGSLLGLFVLLNYVLLPTYVDHGGTVGVPRVTGVPLATAVAILDSIGLQAVEADTRPDPREPVGTVVAQNPQPDAIVKFGRRVYLTISGWEKVVSVPQLRGRSIRDARFALERSGLKLGAIEYVTSDTYPENTIVEQSVLAEKEVPKGTRVGITISRGRRLQETTVPELIGKSVAESEKLLAQRGLKVGNITYQTSFDLIPNTVVDQFPRPGESVQDGQAIDLFVVKIGKPKEEIQLPRK